MRKENQRIKNHKQNSLNRVLKLSRLNIYYKKQAKKTGFIDTRYNINKIDFVNPIYIIGKANFIGTIYIAAISICSINTQYKKTQV